MKKLLLLSLALAVTAEAQVSMAKKDATNIDPGTWKTTLALENVDNTSDANKPLSTASTTALAGKWDSLSLAELKALPVTPANAGEIRLIQEPAYTLYGNPTITVYHLVPAPIPPQEPYFVRPDNYVAVTNEVAWVMADIAGSNHIAYAALIMASQDNTRFNEITISQSGSNVYYLPNIGGAEFVMDEGNQTIGGAKTFSGSTRTSGSLTADGMFTANGEIAQFYTGDIVFGMDGLLTGGVLYYNKNGNSGGVVLDSVDDGSYYNLKMPAISGDIVVDEGTQTIGGTKTFTNSVRVTGTAGLDFNSDAMGFFPGAAVGNSIELQGGGVGTLMSYNLDEARVRSHVAFEVHNGLHIQELANDPANPEEGHSVLWQATGAGSGDDGDILIKITAGAVTKTVTLVDFSAAP